MGYVQVVCAIFLVLVFVVSAGAKLRGRVAFQEFADSLVAMSPAPGRRMRRIAVALLTAEIGMAILLAYPGALGVMRFVVPAALLAVLTGGVWGMLHRRVGVRCRCFGASAAPLSRVHLVRNLLLIVVACVGGSAAIAGGTTHPTGVAIAAAAGGVGAIIVIRLDDLVALFADGTMSVGQRGS